jgi:hypothetical protein
MNVAKHINFDHKVSNFNEVSYLLRDSMYHDPYSELIIFPQVDMMTIKVSNTEKVCQ